MCGPNLVDTTTSVTVQDIALHDLYSMRAAQISSGMQYDCAAFDKDNACFTFAGRLTDIGANDAHAIDGAFIGGYRLSPNMHIGGFINVGPPGKAGGNVTVDNNVPGLGLFGAWGQHPDGSGFTARLAGTFQTSSVEIRRAEILEPFFLPPFFIPGSEAGQGQATLNSGGVSAVFSYGMSFSQWFAAPYFALQATDITRGGYTEDPSVIDPLTYKTLTDRQTTAIVGLHARHRLSERTTLHLGGGWEHDLNHDISNNVATSTLGTSTAVFGQSYRQNRGTVTGGLSFDVAPMRTVNVTLDLRQEALGNATSGTGIVAYQVGF